MKDLKHEWETRGVLLRSDWWLKKILNKWWLVLTVLAIAFPPILFIYGLIFIVFLIRYLFPPRR